MAYVNKEIKDKAVAAIKKVLPKNWKATFSVRSNMVLVCTIRKAPLVLTETFVNATDSNVYNVNQYHYQTHCKNEEVKNVLKNILEGLNIENYNNSDVATDYFDVGYYIELQFGDYKKDFESVL